MGRPVVRHEEVSQGSPPVAVHLDLKATTDEKMAQESQFGSL